MKAFRFAFPTPQMNIVAASLAITLALAWTPPSLAQGSDLQILIDRMERLERDIRTLNQQIARMPAGGPVVDGAADAAPMDAAPMAEDKNQFIESEGTMQRALVRLNTLEGELRTTTGQVESMAHRVEQIGVRLEKMLTDIDFRLARLEGGTPMTGHGGGQSGNAYPTMDGPQVSAAPMAGAVARVGELPPPTAQAPQANGVLGSMPKKTLDTLMADQEGEGATDKTAQAAAVEASPVETAKAGEQAAETPAPETPAAETQVAAASSILPEGSIQDRYQFAFNLVRQARYDQAEQAFKAFIEAHEGDPLTTNARYWVAETYYVRKRYMEAAQAFYQAYQGAPGGSKAPDSLLKLGMSMANLDKTEEACASFTKLRKEFVDLKPTIEKTLNRETQRLECK